MGWSENMSNVVRNIIFKDAELKSLMAIPEADLNNIISFRDKYFVKGPITDQQIITEGVRILWYENEPTETTAPNILKHSVIFDIYVQTDLNYTAGLDRMISRGELIGNRLIALLNKKRLFNIRFESRGIFDQTSKAKGYSRKVAVFSYKRIY